MKTKSIALAALFVVLICLPRHAEAACTPRRAAELNRQGLELLRGGTNEEAMNALVKNGKNADAMSKFSAALDCYPNNPEYRRNFSMTWHALATYLFSGGNYKDAVTHFKNALVIDKSNNKARDALAVAETKLKENEAAGDIRKSPPIRPILGVGVPQHWQPPANASESTRKAAKENETGIREFDKGEYLYAAAAFERALMLDQNNFVYRRNRAKALHGLGKYYLRAGMTPAAEITLKSARDDDPANENIRADLAIAERQSAEANAKEASRIAKEGDTLLHDRGDYSGYIAKYREALRYDPSNSSIRDRLVMDRMYSGSALRRNGDLAGAIAAYREAVSFNSSYYILNESARRNLGICEAELASKMGDLTKAIQKYRHALEVRPSSSSNGAIWNALFDVQLRLATQERQDLLKRGDTAAAEAKSRSIVALEATSNALRQTSYSTSTFNAQRLSEFNVLRYATLNPQTGNITLVGIYDPAYPSGPIAYYDLLADALQNSYPKFSLAYDPDNPALRQIERKIDLEIDLVQRDKNYGVAWLRRLMMTALDPTSLSDDRLLLKERLSLLGIPPDAFATYLAWDQRSGLLEAAFREQIALVTAKLLAAVGVDERIGYAVIGLKEMALALQAKQKSARENRTSETKEVGDITLRIFQSLGIEGEFYRIQEAQMTGRITNKQEMLEVLGIIYGGVLRGLKVPEGEVTSLMEGFRAGRISEETVTSRLNPQFIALVGQSMSQNLFNGFRLSGVNLSRMYSLSPIMSHLQLFGSRPDSSMMRVFFNADYALKNLSHATIAANSVLRHESFEQHLSLAASRAGSASARLPARGVVRLWVFPGKVTTDVFPDGTGIRFDTATVRIGAEPVETPTEGDSEGKELLRQVLNSYAEQLTDHFDDYARAYPSLHVVRETEKVLALARWIKSQKGSVAAPEPQPLRTPLPESVEALWGLTYIVKSSGTNDEIYLGVSGGVSFDKQEGEDWIQLVPNVEATDDMLHQLTASTAFAQQAVEKALSGDLDAARDLAEKSAQAMTGQIDRTTLPQLPTPEFTPPSAETTVAMRMEVARAAVTVLDQNIRAIGQASVDQDEAAPFETTTPERYQKAVEAAEKVRLRAERNLKHLSDLLAQYGLRPGESSTVVAALRNLDPNAPGAETNASPSPDSLGPDKGSVESQFMELQSEIDGLSAKVPALPPIPEADVSLEWRKITPGEKSDAIYEALNLLVLGYDLAGRIGSKTVPAMTIAIIAGEAINAGQDAADVYILNRDAQMEDALKYLRDREKDSEGRTRAERFVEIVQKMKSGTGTIPISDADMLPAARAMLDANKRSAEIFWDAMLSPEAMAAMVRKASIEAVLNLPSLKSLGVSGELGKVEGAGSKLEDAIEHVTKYWTRDSQMVEANRLARRKAQHLLEGVTDPHQRQLYEDTIKASNKSLANSFKWRAGFAKEITYVTTDKFGSKLESDGK
ncbi:MULTISPECIES: tetratricopeptide repeat protein [unclassified Bradyrhizobium]|uniref:tetratricopeptide repeat protein n=1 Tax=unclassified Bradyrhizobium TaxID=2631580 RepID=UPI002916FCAD|nr:MULTISPECIES: tetratricopeptide repeat protein [unclassified Bradyrhizobium]